MLEAENLAAAQAIVNKLPMAKKNVLNFAILLL